ncbi:Serpentine Receptor, class BC (class B-like) [Caenorhabditis elegans]|uniref:Serpentine Receptor, class BC (Class B-like) n=1 Tax=Caenorhabditis elegans TaxID=6239 RepID=Q9XXP2_CAEEL|nr:Serpentine Receptor, class BC (class B-like) [Caenorhabditis elegans]CAA16502.2 Serpentine Receptor, class BC (class B-like) [Caenorhabditis elegans]|eukprot:NP_001352241.1 Serpentine Receptor, class BC (class B-like) [Caenorhabditis elegans]
MLLIKTATVSFSFLFTQAVFYLNFYLLHSIFVSKKLAKKPDLVLIYFRFSVDMVYSFFGNSNCTHRLNYHIHIQFSSFSNFPAIPKYQFRNGWPNNDNVQEYRIVHRSTNCVQSTVQGSDCD